MNDRITTSSEINDEFESRLQSAVWSVLSDPLPREAIERVTSRAMDLEQEESFLTPANPISARWNQRWAKVAALAVCLLLAFGLLMTLPSSNAFAQVVANISKLATAKFTIENIGESNFIAEASVKAPDLLRLDFQLPGRPVNITNSRAGELISFDSLSSQVSINEIPNANSNFDILQALQTHDVQAVASLEENSLSGTELYDIFNGQGKVWVDLETNLPIRIEMTQLSGSKVNKVVYRDFQWNVPLDDNLFMMPADRDVVRSSLLAAPKESELVAAFAIRQAFSQEPYEASFFDGNSSDISNAGLRLGQLAYDRTQNRAQNFQRQSSKLKEIWEIVGITLVESNDPSLVQQRIDFLCMKLDQWSGLISRTGGWVGTGVRPGEPKALCWWRDGSRVRVLLADLTILDADQPPMFQ